MEPMHLYEAFFNPDGEVQLAHGDIVCIKGAAVACLWDVVSNNKTFIHSQKNGFQCITANHRTQTLLVAEYCKNPQIHVYQKGKKMFSLTEGIGTLQISKMSLSHDGKYLIIVNEIPQYSISVIDMTSRQRLKGQNSNITLNTQQGIQLKSICFNPTDSSQFAVLYNNEITLYKIDIDYQVQGENISENHRILKTKNLNGEGFESVVYDSKGNLYITTSTNKLHYLNRQTFRLYPENNYETSQTNVRVLVLTQRHLILLYASGLIEWLNRFEEDMIDDKDETLRPFFKCYSANINPFVKSAVYNHKMNRLVVGHQNGLFTVILCQAERGIKQRQQDDHDLKQQQGQQEEAQILPKQLNLQVQLQGPFHTKTVTVIGQFTSSPVIVTAGLDGRVIFWNLDTKCVISNTQFAEQFVSGELNIYENLLVLGTARGCLMLFLTSQQGKVSLIYETNILENISLNQVKFNPDSTLIAATSVGLKSIYYISIMSKGKCNVVGYIQTVSEIEGIAWNTSGKHITGATTPQLFILMNSLLGTITSPAQNVIETLNRGESLKLDLEFFVRKIDPDQQLIQVLPSGQLFITGKDKVFRKYKQPEQFIGKVQLKSRTSPNPPIQQMDGHNLTSNCISVSLKNNIVSTGGKDGTIIIRNCNNLQKVVGCINSQNLKQNGVSSILFSNVGNFVIAGGYDGSLVIWTSHDITSKQKYSKKQKPTFNFRPIQSKGLQLQHYQIIQQKQYLKSIEAQIIQKKKSQMDKLNILKNDLQKLLEENQKHQQIQQLPRDEFAIDIEARQKILNQGKQICQHMRQDSIKLNLKNQIMSIKLKERTWDQMNIQLRGMNGLRANILVYNYQIRNRSDKQLRKIKLILDMRRNAIKQSKDRKTKGIQAVLDIDLLKNKCIVNGGYPTVLVLTDYEKPQQKKQDKMKKKKQQEQQKPKRQEPPQTDEEWGLLYSVFELFSDNAKRNQIFMIRNIIFKIKQTFNKEFDSVLHQRQASVDIINDKNKRLIQIYQQLKRQLDLTQCNRNILQNPDKILAVKPAEVGFQKYLSRNQREKLEKQRLKQQERLKLLAQDDGAQRALNKMMNGTLEQKKQSALQIVVERQKWMDKPAEQMNDDQKMKLKEYEVKKAKAEQQKQRTIKQLQIEIRKLKSQIEDVLQKFDERLLVLFKRKLQYDYRIEEEQLYIEKLLQSMLSFVEGQDKLKQLEVSERKQKQELNKMEEGIAILKQFADEILKNKQAKKQALEARRGNELQIRIKNVEKNVFQEFNNSNPKQKRKIRDKWIQTEPELSEKIIKLDPYLAIQSNQLWEHKSKQFSTYLESIKVIQQNYQGSQQALLNALETRFNLRKQQNDLDRKFSNISSFIQQLENFKNNLSEKCKQTQRQIKETNNFLATSQSNIEVELRLKQGNVELQTQKPVSQLSEAILLPRQAIESKNHSILQSAGEKIEVMKKIKICKISVTQQQLNLKSKQHQAQQLYNKIKAIQMLKVKKQMQTALVKKDIKMNENEIKSIQQQIDNLHKQSDKRVSVFQKKIDKINFDILSIQKQNDQLQLQKQSLQQTVKQRLKIQQMMNNQGSSDNQARQKFDQISTNRKLFDLAKKQTEQIELLRQELAKLKAKTFANFSNIQR